MTIVICLFIVQIKIKIKIKIKSRKINKNKILEFKHTMTITTREHFSDLQSIFFLHLILICWENRQVLKTKLYIILLFNLLRSFLDLYSQLTVFIQLVDYYTSSNNIEFLNSIIIYGIQLLRIFFCLRIQWVIWAF